MIAHRLGKGLGVAWRRVEPASGVSVKGSAPGRRTRVTGFRRHLGLAITSLLLGAWFLFLRPGSLGGPADYVMVAGVSMEPTLKSGDLAITHSQETYRPGDVVAYRIPEDDFAAGAMVIHRITGGSAQGGYILQGDNSAAADLWRPKVEDIEGRLWLRIAGGARVVRSLRSPFVAASLATLFALGFFLRATRKREPAPETDSVPSGAERRPRPPAGARTKPAVRPRRPTSSKPVASRRRTPTSALQRTKASRTQRSRKTATASSPKGERGKST